MIYEDKENIEADLAAIDGTQSKLDGVDVEDTITKGVFDFFPFPSEISERVYHGTKDAMKAPPL